MNIRFFGQKHGAALAALGTVLFLTQPLSAEADEVQLLTGGGYGPTPEVAVQAAIWDAEASAGAYQLYTCELVGEPSVFLQNNSIRGTYCTAEATLRCTREH